MLYQPNHRPPSRCVRAQKRVGVHPCRPPRNGGPRARPWAIPQQCIQRLRTQSWRCKVKILPTGETSTRTMRRRAYAGSRRASGPAPLARRHTTGRMASPACPQPQTTCKIRAPARRGTAARRCGFLIHMRGFVVMAPRSSGPRRGRGNEPRAHGDESTGAPRPSGVAAPTTARRRVPPRPHSSRPSPPGMDRAHTVHMMYGEPARSAPRPTTVSTAHAPPFHASDRPRATPRIRSHGPERAPADTGRGPRAMSHTRARTCRG